MPSIITGTLILAGGVFALHVLVQCCRVLRADADGSRPSELVWILLPLVVVAVLFLVALRGEVDGHKTPAPQKFERLSHLHTRGE